MWFPLIGVQKGGKWGSLNYTLNSFYQAFPRKLAGSPDDWSAGTIIPIFLEKAIIITPLDYMPISLTSLPSKIIERIISSNVTRFLESNSFFNPHQLGFRKGCSCESQVVSFVHDLHLNLDANIQTGVIFRGFADPLDTFVFAPHS